MMTSAPSPTQTAKEFDPPLSTTIPVMSIKDSDHLQVPEKKKKRPICSRCNRPKERACICKALPDTRLSLKKCQVVVLQHPHEAKRKNRSLPFVELCVEPQSFHTVVARRFGNQIDANVLKLLRDPNQHVLLVYPDKGAVSLTQGLQQIQERKNGSKTTSDTDAADDKITVVLIDGTWKESREMHVSNTTKNQYPDHIIKVALSSNDFENNTRFKPARFDIRTPPSPDHLSTAECIAWIVSIIEEDATYYDTIMKPLDLMVEQWRSFSNRGTFSFKKNGDGEKDESKQNTAVATRNDKKRKHQGQRDYKMRLSSQIQRHQASAPMSTDSL